MICRWKEELERMLEASPDRDPSDVMTDLWELGATMGEQNAEILLNSNPGFSDYRPSMKRAHYLNLVGNEVAQSRRFLAQDSTKGSFVELANSNSRRLYDRAGEMFDHLNLHECRRIVLVGCGWLPATLFYFHDNTDVPELVGLDVNPNAVSTAQELARHLGYERLRTELRNGQSYDYSGAKIVYIVAMVSDKPAILSTIAETAPDDVQVLVSEPYSLGHLFADAVESTLDPRFEVVWRGPKRRVLTHIVCLRRSRGIPDSSVA